MKLSDWAKQNGINYQTAYRWYKAGKLPASAYQADTGTIIITENSNNTNQRTEKDENMYHLINHKNNWRENDIFNFLEKLTNDDFVSAYKKLSSNKYLELNYPKTKWLNKEDKYLYLCACPGFEEKNINISVKENILTISGKIDESNDEHSFLYGSQQSFEQSWTLGNDADCSQITAKFNNGVLSVTVPKLKNKSNEPIKILINK